MCQQWSSRFKGIHNRDYLIKTKSQTFCKPYKDKCKRFFLIIDVFHRLKLLNIVFKSHAFVLALVTDDGMDQGYFIDYTQILFAIMSYAFNYNDFIHFLHYF